MFSIKYKANFQNRINRVILFVLLCTLINAGTVRSDIVLPQRSHPFLLADDDMIDRAKARSQQYIWASNTLSNLLTSANKALNYQNIPDSPGSDESHKSYLYNVQTLGLAYALSGYENYAAGARNILMQYADVVPQWGYILDQILSDAVYGTNYVWGYDLIYNSPCLSESDKAHIEQNLILPIAARMQSDVREGNHQAWHNAYLIAAGLVIEDAALVAEAIDGVRGLRWQLRNRVLNDGWWCETTPSYHLFALDAIRYTVQAAKMAGMDYSDNPAVKAMFDAPLSIMMPNNTLPSINDTAAAYSMAEAKRYIYEQGYAMFGDPRYLSVLNLGPRDNYESLIFGADEFGTAQAYPVESTLCPEAGFASLRNGSGNNQIYVNMDYGPHGEWHGHRDKLSIVMYALGKELAPDLSVAWYDMNYKTPQWMYGHRHTIAHNTICVDKMKQEQAEGELKLFYSSPDVSLVQAQCCRNAYKDVLLRRTVVAASGYIIDVFSAESSNSHTYDWVYHNYGSISSSLDTSVRNQPIGYGSGYQYINNIKQGRSTDDFSVDFNADQANVRVNMLGADESDIFLCDTVMGEYDWPTMVVRRFEKNTVFVSVIEPFEDTPKISDVSVIPVRGSCNIFAAVKISFTDSSRADYFMLAGSGGVSREFSDFETESKACYVRTDFGTVTAIHHID